MAALIEAAKDASYPAEISLVISNRPDAAGLATAAASGIPTTIVDHTTFGKDRDAFERALQAVLAAYRIDIVCLAGFMRLLTAGFVIGWAGRMLNIHPALLPAFKVSIPMSVQLKPAPKFMAPPSISSRPRWTPVRRSPG